MEYLKVDIYIHAKHKGNPRGAGEATAILEFISRKNEAHIRKATAAVENDTKKRINPKSDCYGFENAYQALRGSVTYG